ncbi:MAG: hypothetical protein OEP52_06005 [Acidimicrobiia bacterium]|nr:hypothetical protein [Acidimicrobiia bacterium]
MNPKLARALRRAGFHLLRAGVETLKALEAIVDELTPDDEPEDEADRPTRIPVQ